MQCQRITNDISLQPACKERLEELAQNLRAADAAEIAASHRLAPREVLEECVRGSLFSAALVWRGKTVAAFGLAPQTLTGSCACVWLLTGEELPKIAKTFFKISKRAVAYFKKQYPQLYCVTDVRYDAARRYLLRLGFREQGPEVVLEGAETKFQYYQIK